MHKDQHWDLKIRPHFLPFREEDIKFWSSRNKNAYLVGKQPLKIHPSITAYGASIFADALIPRFNPLLQSVVSKGPPFYSNGSV